MTANLVVVRTDRNDPNKSFYHGNENGHPEWGGPEKMFLFSSVSKATQFASSNPNFHVFIAGRL